MDMSKQTPPGKTGTPKNTPKSIPGGPLKPAATNAANKPTGAKAPTGRQGRG